MQRHIAGYHRTHNGQVIWVPEHERETHAHLPHAEMHERTVAGVNRGGQHYIRATNSEDRGRVMGVARALGVEVAEHRQSGANHHGRQGAYPHIYFHDEHARNRVMHELHRQGQQLPPQQAQPAAPEPAPTTLSARDQGKARANEFLETLDGSGYDDAEQAVRIQQEFNEMNHLQGVDLDEDDVEEFGIGYEWRLRQRYTELTGVSIDGPDQPAASTPEPATPAPPAGNRLDQPVDQGNAHDNHFFGRHRAGILDRRVVLENTEGNHNKFYIIDLRQVGPGQWVVNTGNGRIDSRGITIRTKTDTPLSQAQANAMVDRIKREKQHGNYEVREDGDSPRLIYTAMDNWQHPSVMPQAQVRAEAAAAAMATPPAPAPAPAPQEASATRPPTVSDYDAQRQIAYNVGDRARTTTSQFTLEAFRNSAKAAEEHQKGLTMAQSLGITSGSNRGSAWHQERLTAWKTAATNQWKQAVASSVAVIKSGMGDRAAVMGAKATLQALVAERPAWMALPQGVTEASIRNAINYAEASAAQGEVRGAILGAMTNADLNVGDRAKAAAMVIRSAIGTGAISATGTGEALAGKLDQVQEAYRRLKAAHDNQDAEPEALGDAAAALEARWNEANAVRTSLPEDQRWHHPLEAIQSQVATAVQQAGREAQTRRARPRKADPRYVRAHEAHQTAAHAAHQMASANGASRTAISRALEAHKAAAVSTYHVGLQHPAGSPERLAHHAKAQEHANHAKAMAERLRGGR